MGMTGVPMLQSSLGSPPVLYVPASPYLLCILIYASHLLLLSLSPLRPLTQVYGPSVSVPSYLAC